MRSLLILILCLVGRAGYGQSVPVIDIDPRTDVADPPGPGQFNGFEQPGGGGESLLGWEFSVIESIIVTSLAWYDEGEDGLSVNHRVGLWEDPPGPSNTNLLFEATVPEGVAAELIGPWRTIQINPLRLEPATYVIAGMDTSGSTDVLAFVLDSALPIDARIVDFAPTSRSDGIFAPSEIVFLAPGVIFGPTFFVEPVPEPSTIILLAVAIPFLLVRRYWF